MNNNENEENKSPLKMILIIAAAIAAIGSIYLMMGKSQASDPTLTQAPPAGANAKTLQPSAEKMRNGGKMKPMPFGPSMQPVQMPKEN